MGMLLNYLSNYSFEFRVGIFKTEYIDIGPKNIIFIPLETILGISSSS